MYERKVRRSKRKRAVWRAMITLSHDTHPMVVE